MRPCIVFNVSSSHVWIYLYLVYAVEQLPVETRHVISDLPRAQHLEETARANFRTFLVH